MNHPRFVVGQRVRVRECEETGVVVDSELALAKKDRESRYRFRGWMVMVRFGEVVVWEGQDRLEAVG